MRGRRTREEETPQKRAYRVSSGLPNGLRAIRVSDLAWPKRPWPRQSHVDITLADQHDKVRDVGPTYYPIDPGTGLATGGVPTGAFHTQNKNHSWWKVSALCPVRPMDDLTKQRPGSKRAVHPGRPERLSFSSDARAVGSVSILTWKCARRGSCIPRASEA